MNNKNHDTKNQNQIDKYHHQGKEDDDFYIDESLIHLFRILLPRMKWIISVSCVAAFSVALYLYLSPRTYECTTVVAPDVMRDFSSVDLVQLRAGEESSSMPFASQLSQLQTLATSSQVKKNIIEDLGLRSKWECETIRDCIDRLDGIYSVREIRNVGLELSAQHENNELTLELVEKATELTNQYFENYMKSKAEKSIKQISSWIHDVTREIQKISNEYIQFASEHNITDLQTQYSSGSSLLSTIKENIVLKEAERAEMLEMHDENSKELKPIDASLKRLRETLDQLMNGTETDGVYPPLSEFERLKLKSEEYKNHLNTLQNRAELFSKSLAAAQIESQKQSTSIMVLDEPYVEPVGQGTIKFAVLTAIGMFFFLCVAIILKEYFLNLYQMCKQSDTK